MRLLIFRLIPYSRGMTTRTARTLRSLTALAALVSSAMAVMSPSTANARQSGLVEASTDFIAAHEDVVDYMYPDRTSVATAAGNNMSLRQAQQYTWLRPDGSVASSSEVARNYYQVASYVGSNSRAARFDRYDALRLDPQSQRAMVSAHMQIAMETVQRKFNNFNNLPMNVKVAALSMTWALGEKYNRRNFPRHFAAIERGDYRTAAIESHMHNVSDVSNAQHYAMFSDVSQIARYEGAFSSGQKRAQLAAASLGRPYRPSAERAVVRQAVVEPSYTSPRNLLAPRPQVQGEFRRAVYNPNATGPAWKNVEYLAPEASVLRNNMESAGYAPMETPSARAAEMAPTPAVPAGAPLQAASAAMEVKPVDLSRWTDEPQPTMRIRISYSGLRPNTP